MKRPWWVALAALGIAANEPAAASTVPAAHPARVCSDHAAEAAARSGLGVDVIMRVMRAESGGDARAVSPKGAIGCMQIMPPTWADLTARYALGPDPFDGRLNMIGGALYLAELMRQFGPEAAYAAYNAGPRRYIRYAAGGVPLPAETIAYVTRFRGDAALGSPAPVRVRWQAASLFLAYADSAETENSRTVSQPAAAARVGALDPAQQASASRAKASETLFPLSRNEPLPQAKPHAHVMLTMREVGPDGLGAKQRDWNATALLQNWRENWATHVNGRLQSLEIDARIDHRSYEAQGVGLEPQHKIGAAGARRLDRGEDAERADEHRAIAQSNGAKILANPEVGLEALTRTQATFTIRDLALFAHRHSDGKEQFDRVLAAIRGSDALLALGRDGQGNERFTTVSMRGAEEALVRNADALARASHRVSSFAVERAVRAAVGRGMVLGSEQRRALEHVTKTPGLSLVVGYAGAGKSAMLGVAREGWEAAGYTVRGAALSGIAAENLEGGSGIASRTIASLEHSWARDRDRLTSRDVLVVDEAGMIGTRQLGRVLAEAAHGGAKVVLVGDVQQLQAIEAGAAFRLLAERHGAAEISEVRRQTAQWMRDATRAFATGRTGGALAAFTQAGMVHAADTRDAARAALIDRWDAERQADPARSRIILSHTNAEVAMLNQAARQRLAERGELGTEVAVQTERGVRQFADNDRILFLQNERSLGVKNGSLGTVEAATRDSLAVRLDDGRQVKVDLKTYAHVDHGYAATVHKTQGMTVDRTHVLATPGLDAHATYVALSRHRDGTALHYGRDDFADEVQLRRTLSRERPKDMAMDYESAARATAPVASLTPSLAADTASSTSAAGPAADTDRVGALRAMIAARLSAPRHTPETMRQAMAAAKAAPAAERENDYGAGR